MLRKILLLSAILAINSLTNAALGASSSRVYESSRVYGSSRVYEPHRVYDPHRVYGPRTYESRGRGLATDTTSMASAHAAAEGSLAGGL